jgi:glutaredoxin
LLSSLGVQFEHLNVWEDEEAVAFLESKGIKSVPVLCINDEIIVGFDEPRIRQALGLDNNDVTDLEWLRAKYEMVFSALNRAVRQLDNEQLPMLYPQRNMTVREQALHVANVCEGGYLTHMRGGYTYDDMTGVNEDGPNVTRPTRFMFNAVGKEKSGRLLTIDEICEYTDGVCGAITSLISSGDRSRLEMVVDSYYGGHVPVQRVLHVVLRHGSHHLRQLYAFMENDLAMTLDNPLTSDDLSDVELPPKLFL